jgi:hypothetical protein
MATSEETFPNEAIAAPRARILIDGAIAGLLGALTVALWFLAFDVARGHPLQTPCLLGEVILHGKCDLATPLHSSSILGYTAFHFGVFIIFGICGAWLLDVAERERSLLVSVFIFLIAFEVFFVAVVVFLGPAVADAVTWWSVLVGNLLATAVMLTYFFSRHSALGRELLGPWVGVVREGVWSGLIGGSAVAVWFLLYDLTLGQPFRTPGLLGAAIFSGLRDPADLHVSAAIVVGYTVVHFTAFILFGLLAAFMLAASEREPLLLLGVFVMFACFEVFFVGFATLVAMSLVEALGWWPIVAGNILAATAMVAFFLARHPALRGRMVERWASES